MIDDLTIHYQPIVDLYTQRIVAAEALARFDGVSSTQRLLEVTADPDGAADFTTHVFLQALSVLKELPGDMYISVNLPPTIFATGKISERLPFDQIPREMLGRLVVEITETGGPDAKAPWVLHGDAWAYAERAKELGLRVAIDDFGTGSSSLGRLLEVDFDIIKIDRAFVRRIAKDAHAEKVIRAIAALARSLRTTTIAEGIEYEDQAVICRAVGVDYGQGWLWHRAMPAEELLALPNLGAHG